MTRRILMGAVLALAIAALTAATASANQTNAPDSLTVTVVCDQQPYLLAVNGNGTFTPGHVIGTSMELVPTAFQLTFSFRDSSGNVDSNTVSATKPGSRTGRPSETCDVPAGINTTQTPNGTLTVSGWVTGFFAHT
ncbi:MAG TPA: hypothetical protein VHL51_00585 [Gaiellales bacterium]|nr:hypothetical protein [Gaiellales bacterium]